MPKIADTRKSIIGLSVDPTECPFREFKDSELSPDFWGMGTAAFRSAGQRDKSAMKQSDSVWVDDNIQPLPRSVRHYLDGWMRAEDLARSRFEAEISVCDDNDEGRMSATNYTINHLQVLQRSSFCRRVLCNCFILERNEGMTVEHQWDGFSFSLGPEGWRPKFHIYTPGLKPGGGQQHKPTTSKNGCYLVRLFYLGCWRCVWVSDDVPIDASGSPLLPFSPLLPSVRVAPTKGKQPAVPITKTILLWPLLLCKALLKLCAPDMHDDDGIEDECDELNIIHALTGAVSVTTQITDIRKLWADLKKEVPEFTWYEDVSNISGSVAKSKAPKKTLAKETTISKVKDLEHMSPRPLLLDIDIPEHISSKFSYAMLRDDDRASMTSILIADTKDEATFKVPGISPCHEMNMMVTMIRDVPLKKPLSEPDIPLWKTYRWLDWAKSHGLYDSYECSRDKYLKCIGLLKLSYCPQMLDVISSESVNVVEKTNEKNTKKGVKEQVINEVIVPQNKEEIRDWVAYEVVFDLIKNVNVTYFPSMLKCASAASVASIHPNKALANKSIDVQAPKFAPLYLQVDSPEAISLHIAFTVCHPRVLAYTGHELKDYTPPAYLLIEKFKWFEDVKIAKPYAFIQTEGYDSVKVEVQPGRHFFRLWVNSRLHWYYMIISEANLLLGPRYIIQAAAVKECPWSSRFLLGISTAFSNWIRGKSATQMKILSTEFYRSYLPDLPWINSIVGYPRPFLHWMFRQALLSLLIKRLNPLEYRSVCKVLRRLFYDPDFGLSEKFTLTKCNELFSDDYGIVTDVLNGDINQDQAEIEEMKKQNKAAMTIQSNWRKFRVLKCFSSGIGISADIQKAIMDAAFGNLDALSSLMNIFFSMYPGCQSAYSVSSALNGTVGFQQYSGTSIVTPKCKWIPFFQGQFHCHHPLKINFDLRSNLQHTFYIFNNDTKKQMNTEFHTTLTQDFKPNQQGYSIIGHASFDKVSGCYNEAPWTLSILSSIRNEFHVCDSPDVNICREQPLLPSKKIRLEEIFVPNKRNILGAFQFSVTQFDCISFRAATSIPEVEIEATLKTTNSLGEVHVLDKCKGKGEIYWPFIVLNGPPIFLTRRMSPSSDNLTSSTRIKSLRSVKSIQKSPKPGSAKVARSILKIDTVKLTNKQLEPKMYTIEVTMPGGWPLTINQWLRVEEVKNSFNVKFDTIQKKPKEKTASAKEKEKEKSPHPSEPRLGDPFTELEVSITTGGGITVRRDDGREVAFTEARKLWDAENPGRNERGAIIRKDFRDEYLVQSTQLNAGQSIISENDGDMDFNDNLTITLTSEKSIPVSETDELNPEHALYIEMPEQLKDKFKPLDFIPLCTKDETVQKTLLTTESADAAAIARKVIIETAAERMNYLQLYNTIHVLGRQRKRDRLVDKYVIDSKMSDCLLEAFEERDRIIRWNPETPANDNKAKKK